MRVTLSAVLPQSAPDGFAIGDFWSLTQQAGPLRWPIFFILAFGLVQVFIKLYELIRDRAVSGPLRSADYSRMSLSEIARLVGRQEESMLSSLQATMINVFQTRPSEGLLHDEITNFVQFKQDQFEVFRRRMEFLSDTAGALGLMGTVWGMFTVFFQGTAEQDVILRGMGIALITTLLGLVVSIILNFSSTELSTFFNTRLEQVSEKSDQLRFRLMELAPELVPAQAVMSAPQPASESPPPPSSSPASEALGSGMGGGTGADGPPTRWRYVEFEDAEGSMTAGATRRFSVAVKNEEGKPAAGVPVFLKIPNGDASLAGGGRTLRKTSDEGGLVSFDCTAPERASGFTLEASLPEQPGSSIFLEVDVKPGPPDRVDQEGNNQAAVAGTRLPLPIGVRVYDGFGNAVHGVPVRFSVEQGDGHLASGQREHRVATNGSGLAATPFVVSSAAGQNVVKATVDGAGNEVRFVAFATEA